MRAGKKKQDEGWTARRVGRKDIEFFANWYFPHYCTVPGSRTHTELYRFIREGILSEGRFRAAIAAPREFAKSTLSCLILPLWCICYPDTARKRFILIASDTGPQAEAHIANIKDELESNERLAADFPDAIGISNTWKQDEICTRNGIHIISRGTGGKVRGIRRGPDRPDLLIGDDLENDEQCSTPGQRDKVSSWFFKAFAKTGARADIFVNGTIIHYDSLLSRLLHNPMFKARKYQGVIRWAGNAKLWSEWEHILTDGSAVEQDRERAADEFYALHKAEMDAGAEVIWPEYRSYYELMKLRVSEGPASFDSEIQNEPINPEDCLFQESWFQFYEESDLDFGSLTILAAIDPSLGNKGKQGDYSAIVALGRDSLGNLYVLDADLERRPPDRIIQDARELYGRRRFLALGVENVQFQEFFRQILEREMRAHAQYPPVMPIQQTSDKQMRIQRLQPLVKNGTIKFKKSQRLLLDQLRYYPKADFDDGPDALEMCVSMMENRFARRSMQTGPVLKQRERELKRVFG